ncbi:DUF3151 domain-containing protein [Propionibacteriaceae bacterium Y2011]|uniref:DUF3151 domain-containing protein n=1 Tax=Microlunatus sp. Y2014 TaxID=3418488 RepID=UPI003B46BB04
MAQVTDTHRNLLADGPAPTHLPVDPAAADLAAGSDPVMVATGNPQSSLVWAVLAERALAAGDSTDVIVAYAFARTGYHRGLDALRRSGWRGTGPVPWEHEPNRGFLRALAALAEAARRIGEDEEYERCTQFLRDSSETGYGELIG